MLQVVRRIKEQKMTQNDEKLSFALYITGTIISSSFMVHMCKRIILPGLVYIFSKF